MKTFITKMIPTITACLSLVLFINANTNSCVFMNEPEGPEALSKFKCFK